MRLRCARKGQARLCRARSIIASYLASAACFKSRHLLSACFSAVEQRTTAHRRFSRSHNQPGEASYGCWLRKPATFSRLLAFAELPVLKVEMRFFVPIAAGDTLKLHCLPNRNSSPARRSVTALPGSVVSLSPRSPESAHSRAYSLPYNADFGCMLFRRRRRLEAPLSLSPVVSPPNLASLRGAAMLPFKARNLRNTS